MIYKQIDITKNYRIGSAEKDAVCLQRHVIVQIPNAEAPKKFALGRSALRYAFHYFVYYSKVVITR